MKKWFFVGLTILVLLLANVSCAESTSEPTPVKIVEKYNQIDVERVLITQENSKIYILDRGDLKYVVGENYWYYLTPEMVDMSLTYLQAKYTILDTELVTCYNGYTTSVLFRVQKKN